MQSSTETKPMTTAWQRFAMSATAPSGGANPVYSARVHFAAGAGDTVEIDLVSVGPSEVTGIAWADAQTLTWTAEPSAAEYHIYGGEDANLSVFSAGSCWDHLDTDRTDTTLTDATLPLDGAYHFYLVTAEDGDGNEGPPGDLPLGVRIQPTPCP